MTLFGFITASAAIIGGSFVGLWQSAGLPTRMASRVVLEAIQLVELLLQGPAPESLHLVHCTWLQHDGLAFHYNVLYRIVVLERSAQA